MHFFIPLDRVMIHAGTKAKRRQRSPLLLFIRLEELLLYSDRTRESGSVWGENMLEHESESRNDASSCCPKDRVNICRRCCEGQSRNNERHTQSTEEGDCCRTQLYCWHSVIINLITKLVPALSSFLQSAIETSLRKNHFNFLTFGFRSVPFVDDSPRVERNILFRESELLSAINTRFSFHSSFAHIIQHANPLGNSTCG